MGQGSLLRSFIVASYGAVEIVGEGRKRRPEWVVLLFCSVDLCEALPRT
jgi:hypothetical protein